MKKYRIWIGLAILGLFLAYIARRKKDKANFSAMSVAVNKAFGLRTVPVGGDTLTQDVKVLKILFDNFGRLGDGDMAKFSYIVATAYHESRFGEYMREIGSDSYLKQYDYTTEKGRGLGNTQPMIIKTSKVGDSYR
ncbi:MAG: hypothetical protein HC892_22695 [Saprospiraceae bacterium]|nr:hypothetical protein [Saprospiraceae bacterium]